MTRNTRWKQKIIRGNTMIKFSVEYIKLDEPSSGYGFKISANDDERMLIAESTLVSERLLNRVSFRCMKSVCRELENSINECLSKLK